MKYVLLDLETTGLDLQHSSIIEVGALLIENGAIKDTFSSFASFDGALPDTITRITGITNEMLNGAPQISEVISKLKTFVNKNPVIAHNGFFFDFPLLERCGLKLDEKYDSMEFAFFVLPTNINGHSVGALSQQLLNIEEVPHRALEDCKLEFQIIQILQKKYGKKNKKNREALKYIAQLTGWWWANFLPGEVEAPEHISEFVNKFEPYRKTKPTQEVMTFKTKKIEPADVEKYFNSYISASDSEMDYSEDRPEQRKMASIVANAFNDIKHAVIEAGTGTGKSKAYLVPSLLFGLKNNIPVVISTHTKALQDQLALKEIIHLKDTIKPDLHVAVVKGKKNYVCLEKFEEFTSSILTEVSQRSLYEFGQANIKFTTRLACLLLSSWVLDTERGDWDELPYWLKERIPKRAEQEICNIDELCGKGTCELYDAQKCFLAKARLRARDADIVIINHAIALSGIIENESLDEKNTHSESDMQTKRFSHTILPSEAKFIVFDEAHHLEDDATSAWEHVLSYGLFQLFLQQMYGPRSVLSLINSIAKNKKSAQLTALADSFKNSEKDIKLIIHSIFENILPALVTEDSKGELSTYAMLDEIPESTTELKELLNLLGDLYSRLSSLINTIGIFSDGVSEKFRNTLAIRARNVDRIRKSISAVTENDKTYVRYLERFGSDVEIKAAPLSVAGHLKKYVYDNFSSVVLTSATLTVDKRFDFFANRAGTALLKPDKVGYFSLNSSFNFEKQVKFFVPKGIAYAKNSVAHFEKCIGFFEKAISASNGGALILCSSHAQVDKLYEKLNTPLAKNNIWLLRQTRGISVSSVIRDFKKDINSVLIGTETLWQGVDVPGESLRALFIYKIPYRMPRLPLVKARWHELESKGRNGFAGYYEPLAALILKQGFGRLIRKSTDRGIAVLLDEEFLNKPRLVNSLPEGVHPISLYPDEINNELSKLAGTQTIAIKETEKGGK